MGQRVRNLPAMQDTWILFLGLADPLEKGMATYSSVFVWRIPWTEELGGLQPVESQSQTSLSNFQFLFKTWVGTYIPSCRKPSCDMTDVLWTQLKYLKLICVDHLPRSPACAEVCCLFSFHPDLSHHYLIRKKTELKQVETTLWRSLWEGVGRACFILKQSGSEQG